MRRDRSLRPAAGCILGANLLLVAGCPESGLEIYGKDEPYEEETPSDLPPALELQECPALCDQARTDLAVMGCTVECDVNLGTIFVGDASAAVFSLLTVQGDGEFYSGGSCDVVVHSCPDMTDCRYLAMECFANSSNEYAYCVDEFLRCELAEMCEPVYSDCASIAMEAHDYCMNTGGTDCDEVLSDYLTVCNCAYEDCIGAPMQPHCEEGVTPPPLPAPFKTGNTRWQVSRRFVQRQLSRVAAIATETFAMVMPNASGVPTGLALNTIDTMDALHQLGLRDGDVILSVEGHPVVDLIESPLPLLDLVDAPRVRITLRRNGASRQHEYVFVP